MAYQHPTQGEAREDLTTAVVFGASVGTADLADGAVTTDKLASDALTTEKIAANAVRTGDINDKNVTYAKAAVFISTEQTGTGSAQSIAHGLGSTPAQVLVGFTDTAPATAGDATVVEGTHTTTNVVVTVTTGKKYKVLAWV